MLSMGHQDFVIFQEIFPFYSFYCVAMSMGELWHICIIERNFQLDSFKLWRVFKTGATLLCLFFTNALSILYQVNMIGEGSFSSVYKREMQLLWAVAIKVFSSVNKGEMQLLWLSKSLGWTMVELPRVLLLGIKPSETFDMATW